MRVMLREGKLEVDDEGKCAGKGARVSEASVSWHDA